MHANPDGETGHDLIHSFFEVIAELQNIRALPGRDGEADGGLALIAEHCVGRILIATRDFGHVAQPEKPVADAQIDGAEAFLGCECAADPEADPLRPRLHDAGRLNGILILQRLHKRVDIKSKRRDLPRRKIEIDRLVLGAKDLNLAEIWDIGDAGPDLLDVIAKLAEGQPVGREGIDIAEDIPELVVEAWRPHAGRQLILDVLDVLANLIELPGRVPGRVLESDEDRRLSRRRVAARVVEAIELLQFLLDGIGDLIDGLLDRRPRPLLLDHHRLDGEGWDPPPGRACRRP